MARARPHHRIAFVAFVFFAAATAHAFVPGEFTPNVVDETGTLTSSEVAALNEQIELLRKKADVWAAVYIVPTIGSETIEGAAEATFEAWSLGEAGRDNGVLLMFALQERRARIEVGYGLEADVPDVVARRILDEVILPSFKSEEHPRGIIAGLSALGYARTRDEAFLDPKYELPLSGEELVSKETGTISDLDVDRGLRYWLSWCAVLWVLPILGRVGAYLRQQRSARRLRFLLHLDGAWGVKVFLTINPGIFIFLSPLFLDEITSGVAGALSSEEGQAALRRWYVWLGVMLLLPIVLRTVSYAIGRARANRNPVFRKSALQTVLYLLALDGGGALVAKVMLAIVPGVFIAILPLIMTSPTEVALVYATCVAALAIYLTIQWRFTVMPLISERAWRQAEARRRLDRIKRRVTGTREIFGRSHTYSPSSSSSSGSSSSSSSFGSSSGGGRSGGGGASSGW